MAFYAATSLAPILLIVMRLQALRSAMKRQNWLYLPRYPALWAPKALIYPKQL